MEFHFKCFKFDSSQLSLTKSGQILKLPINEAKVLAVLLSDTDRIFNKDFILEHVWTDRVVSEQSVFQAISNLRNIFGEQAIVTHAKKGYQWNLPLNTAHEQKGLLAESHSLIKYRWGLATLGILSLLAMIIVGLGIHHGAYKFDRGNTTTIKVLPITKQVLPLNSSSLNAQQILTKALNSSPSLSSQLAEVSYAYDELQSFHTLGMNAPVELLNEELALSTKIRKVKTQYIVNFQLLSSDNYWAGVVTGDSMAIAASKLTQHINIVSSSKLLQTNKSNVIRINALLQLLHDEQPNDIITLHKLVTNNIELGRLHQGQILAHHLRDLAKVQRNQHYLAESHLLIGDVLIHQNRSDAAKMPLELARQHFSDINEIEGVYQASRKLAWLSALKNDYLQTKALLSSLNAKLSDEKLYLLELGNKIYMAALANKLKQYDERDLFVTQATHLLDHNDVPEEHYARVYFQQGLFAERAKNIELAEQYYRWVIALFTPEQNAWHKERAQYHLSQMLIKNNRAIQALDIFSKEADLTVKEKVIFSSIHKNIGKYQLAKTYAKQAFNDAVLNGEVHASMDSALLLIELNTQAPTLDNNTQVDDYLIYLQKNVTTTWRRNVKKRLIALGIYDALAPEQYISQI